MARFGADTCVAVARDDEAGWIGWATGPDSQETNDAAISECMAGGGSTCTVVDFACNGASASIADSAERNHFAYATVVAAVPFRPLCTDTMREACWNELDALPGCYIWSPGGSSWQPDTWSGQCSAGLGTGTAVERHNGGVYEYPYVDGKLHGTTYQRAPNGEVREARWVNGERVCVIDRFSDGRVSWDTCNL